uniref:DNA-directed RNA polymerase n=1 Tax=Rhipilia penicilloides TaxID=1979422 RepID=A0A2P0QJ00_9CHLO|nr:RNA polymerase b-subunit [Rhipilia penicilloides]ARO74248.1 RNA polymerase b-subunit [Rhipilia penicilloides]
MKKTTGLYFLFQKWLPSGQWIFESGLRLCNYSKFSTNSVLFQKKENFQYFRKNERNASFRYPISDTNKSDGPKAVKPGSEGRPYPPQKSVLKTLWFQLFEKSNQNTFFLQRPLCFPLQWIQKGDLLSDCSASQRGELALGQNLFVAYMPWEGLNFEDAVLINQKILSKYTSLHIQKYDLEILENSFEQITSHIPSLPPKHLQKLDKNGIIKIGSWVQEKDILVGKIVSTAQKPLLPLLMHEKLLYDLIGQETVPIQEKCFRVPLGSFGRIVRILYTQKNPQYLPKSYQLGGPTLPRLQDRPRSGRLEGVSFRYPLQFVFCSRVPFFWTSFSTTLSKKWLHGRPGSGHSTIFYRWFGFYDIFFQKLETHPSPLQFWFKKTFTSMAASRPTFSSQKNLIHPLFLKNLQKVTIYLAEQRVFQIGDKISGRHGNKGIISHICSTEDMPYCPNGYPLDILLNPLGVPSRMNVGQIFECLLGVTGQIFQTQFQVVCFDEIVGYEASRSFIYSKLLASCTQASEPWLLSKKTPGKCHLFDGRTGQILHQSVSIGSSYLMKLIHIVDDKIHARATGPYSLITQQPLRGRAHHGGQRVGEMEVWALQGFGSAYLLQELLTVKSDDLQGRNQLMHTLFKNTPLRFGTPESFRVVLRELQCLCLDLQLNF